MLPTTALQLDQWIQLQQCESTNELLMSGDYAPGTIVTAQNQTSGRGRSGRRWRQSPQKALYFSGIYAWQEPPGPLFSLAVGLAVLEALEKWPALKPHTPGLGLKWPNDLIRIARDNSLQKIGGILIEGKLQNSMWHSVVGIGINWQGAPEASQEDPISPGALISQGSQKANPDNVMEGQDPESTSMQQFLPFLVERLNAGAAGYQRPDFLRDYLARDVLQQRKVRLQEGNETVESRVSGINSEGSLVLENGTIISDSARHLEIIQ